MAFNLTIGDGEEIEIDVRKCENSCIATLKIGCDEDEGLVYSLVVGIDSAGPEPEFFFHITEVDVSTEGEYYYWSGWKAESKIKDDGHREIILCCVLAMAERVVFEMNIDSFFMITHDGDLPNKALDKFYRVAEAFRRCGYVARAADPFGNKRVWLMERAV